MEQRFLQYMRDSGMVMPGERVIVALSGGSDSVCLLLLFYKCRKALGIGLSAVHVHHGIRGGEADRDAEAAGELCGRLGIPFTLRRADVPRLAAAGGMSLEEAGRKARYEILEEERARIGAGCVAVAHHMDDSAETILYNLLRGSGLGGLSGIAPVRGRIIRPLLGFRHSEILHYLETQGIEYCSDSTNGDLNYARNRIRRRILPEAEMVNGRAVENIVRAGEFLGEADGYFKRLAASVLDGEGSALDGEGRVLDGKEGALNGKEGALDGKGGAFGGAAAAAATLRQLEPPVPAYVFMEMARRAGGEEGLKDFGARHAELLMGLLDHPTGAGIDLPGGLRAWIEYGVLRMARRTARDAVAGGRRPAREAGAFRGAAENVCRCRPGLLPARWDPAKAPGAAGGLIFTVIPHEKGREIPKNQYTKWFDYDKIKVALSVRYRERGDYFVLPSGGRKTVKSFMIDEKIPRDLRDRIPVLAEGSHVLWIVGFRISEAYKVTDSTERILQVRLDGGNTDG